MMDQLTVPRLEQLLESKRARLDSLLKQREQIEKKLASVTQKIDAIEGRRSDGPRGTKPRQRPKNAKTLLQVVLEILAKNKKGLLLNDLAAQVLETGYKTNSTNFANTLYQCLYHNTERIACDPETRLFRLV